MSTPAPLACRFPPSHTMSERMVGTARSATSVVASSRTCGSGWRVAKAAMASSSGSLRWNAGPGSWIAPKSMGTGAKLTRRRSTPAWIKRVSMPCRAASRLLGGSGRSSCSSQDTHSL